MLHRLRVPLCRLPTLALLIAVVSVLPLAACAAAPAATTPPAISFTFSVQGSAMGGNFDLNANGVANATGEVQMTMMTTQPEQHTNGFFLVGNQAYESADGGPYRLMDRSASAGGPLSTLSGGIAANPSSAAELSPDCLTAETSLGTILQQAASGQGAGSTLGIQDLGSATVDGTRTEHIRGTVDLGKALGNPDVAQTLSQIFGACSGGMPAFDPSLLQLVLFGATMNVDAYVDTGAGMPHQYSLALKVPLASLNMTATGTMTPLQAPATITAPTTGP